MLQPLLRRSLLVVTSRPKVLIAVGSTSLSLPFFGLINIRQQKGVACHRALHTPTLAPLPSPHITPFQLFCRLVRLSIWLLPISLLVSLGMIGKDARSGVAPAILARCLEQCGPTFVKLGQWLASRRDLLSDAACQRLAQLHLDVKSSFSVEEQKLLERCKQEGLPMRSIDCSAPLGAGCVAQVYHGETKDGIEVAVKLRRPHIREQVAIDVCLLKFLAGQAERTWTDLKWLSLREALGAFGQYMEEQLDFRREGSNLNRFQENFAFHEVVRVPEVHHQSEDMLVMSFVHGRSLSEVLNDGDMCDTVRLQLWDTLGKMVSKMVFQDNFVHQDLHPGNIRVTWQQDASTISDQLPAREGISTCWLGRLPGPAQRFALWCQNASPFQFGMPFEIYLLDAGMALAVTEQKREFFADVVRHAVLGHAEAAGQAFLTIHERLGLTDLAVAKEEFVKVVGALARGAMVSQKDWSAMGFQSEEEYLNCRLGTYFAKIAQLFADHHIRMDYEIWSLLTSFTLIEGSMYELNGSNNILRCVLPYVCSDLSSFLSGMCSLWRSEEVPKYAKKA